jgi:hypothetical protein
MLLPDKPLVSKEVEDFFRMVTTKPDPGNEYRDPKAASNVIDLAEYRRRRSTARTVT